MRTFIIILCTLTLLSGCATSRYHTQQNMEGMTNDQKIAYLADQNDKLERKERRNQHQLTMARFFPHMFWGR